MAQMTQSGRRQRVAQIYPSLAKLVIVSLGLFLLFSLYQKTKFSEYIESSVSLPSLFKVRNYLGKNPPLNPKIKIFTFDDTTLGRLGAADFTIEQWTMILGKIAEQKPKAIYIDKLFAQVDPNFPNLHVHLQALADIQVPISTISFIRDRPISSRKPSELIHSQHQLDSLYADRMAMVKEGFLPMLNRDGWVAYGPDAKLKPILYRIGHAHHAHGSKADLIVKMGPKLILPHVSLMGPFPLSVKEQKLFIEDRWVPTDSQGRAIVNYFSVKDFYGRSRRMLGILDAAKGERPLAEVTADDVVIILPGMFTGGTDFISTPLGPMPGGFNIASLINSVVSQRWIKPSSYDAHVLALMCLASGLFMLIPGIVSWAIFASMLLGWLLVSFLSFVYLDVMFHVSGPIFAFVTGVLIFISFRDQVRAKLLYFLRVLKTENDQLRNEIDQAKEIAKVFIPAETPEWPGVAFSTFNKPFVDTSGDWFAFEKSPCGRYVHALLCDITGHGVQAAIVVSACRAVLSMITHDRKNLSSPLFLEIYLGALNSTLYAQGRGTHVTTMVGVTVDIEENIAYFVSAGHPSPFYVHVESDEMFQIKLLNSRNNPVGFEKESNIHCGKIQIFPGDSILMFSDGIPFPRNMSRLKELFTQRVDKRIRPSSAENLVNATWRAKNSGQAGVVDDDQSLIWLQFHPQDFQQEKLKKIA